MKFDELLLELFILNRSLVFIDALCEENRCFTASILQFCFLALNLGDFRVQVRNLLLHLSILTLQLLHLGVGSVAQSFCLSNLHIELGFPLVPFCLESRGASESLKSLLGSCLALFELGDGHDERVILTLQPDNIRVVCGLLVRGPCLIGKIRDQKLHGVDLLLLLDGLELSSGHVGLGQFDSRGVRSVLSARIARRAQILVENRRSGVRRSLNSQPVSLQLVDQRFVAFLLDGQLIGLLRSERDEVRVVCLKGLGIIELLQLVGQLFSFAKSCRYKLNCACCRGGSCSWSSGLCICGFSSASINDCEVSGTSACVWFTTAAYQVRNPSGQILGSRRVNTLLRRSIQLV